MSARFAPVGRVGAGFGAPPLAGTRAASALARLQSIFSASVSRCGNSRCRASHTPARCQSGAAILSPFHGLVGSVRQLLALRGVVGLALGAMGPAVQTLLTDRTPAERRGTAFGVLATAQSLGNGGGPVVGGPVAAALGVAALLELRRIMPPRTSYTVCPAVPNTQATCMRAPCASDRPA